MFNHMIHDIMNKEHKDRNDRTIKTLEHPFKHKKENLTHQSFIREKKIPLS